MWYPSRDEKLIHTSDEPTPMEIMNIGTSSDANKYVSGWADSAAEEKEYKLYVRKANVPKTNECNIKVRLQVANRAVYAFQGNPVIFLLATIPRDFMGRKTDEGIMYTVDGNIHLVDNITSTFKKEMKTGFITTTTQDVHVSDKGVVDASGKILNNLNTLRVIESINTTSMHDTIMFHNSHNSTYLKDPQKGLHGFGVYVDLTGQKNDYATNKAATKTYYISLRMARVDYPIQTNHKAFQ